MTDNNAQNDSKMPRPGEPVTHSEDPRLTAYALDELQHAEDRVAVESYLDSSSEGRAQTESTRALADVLSEKLATEDAPQLSPEQRASLASALEGQGARPGARRAVLRRWVTAAAALVLGVLFWRVLSGGGLVSEKPAAAPAPTVAVAEKREAGGLGTHARSAGRSVSGAVDGSQGSGGGGSRVDAPFDTYGSHEVVGVAGGAVNEITGPAASSPGPQKSLGYLSSPKSADSDALSLGERSVVPTGGESYATFTENPFQPLTQDRYSALSTFGIDVDTASYSIARRYLNRGNVPPPDAVRLEEFINAFDYALPEPTGEHPFSVSLDAATAPWSPRHRLVRIGLKGAAFEEEERPPCNLVFLLDVSGSMKAQDKLPLLIESLKMLVRELDATDRVALVTYASGSQLVLPPTSGADKTAILAALDGLSAAGSTHASDGIQQAYRLAEEHFVEGGVNRVLLATDGDFNVGLTEENELETFIAAKAASGVFLTVLGFGTGNLQDSKAEILADRGNGNYAYIDSLNEADKVLVREMGATLVTIAKDVKIQVEFNPEHVASYRLLGYENRALAAKDFRDDTKDAGEIGAGHTVTALYEIVPVNAPDLVGAVDLKYQVEASVEESVPNNPETLTVNLRYKLPDGEVGREFSVSFVDREQSFEEANSDFRFAAAVAAFGMALRQSDHRGESDLGAIYEWAASGKGTDPYGDRAEFLRLVRQAQGLGRY
jgi:Ca-activated chloride channel homolog